MKKRKKKEKVGNFYTLFFYLFNKDNLNNNDQINSLISNKILMKGGIVTFSSYYSNDISAISDLAQDVKNKIIQTNTDIIIFTGEPDKRMSHLAAELADITVNKKNKGIQIMGLTHWENSASFLSEPALQKAWFTMPDQRFRSFYEDKFIKKKREERKEEKKKKKESVYYQYH